MGDDKKPPKRSISSSGLPRDRDVFVPKRATAPYGVPVVPAMNDAPKLGDQDWTTPDTGTHELAAARDTPSGLETLDAEAEFRLRNRVKETAVNTRAIKESSHATEMGVSTMRLEMLGHVDRLDKKITTVKEETKAEIGKVGSKVDTLTGHVVTALSSLNQFQGVVVENQLEKQTITFEAHADVAANQQKLKDRDLADAQKQRRSFWYRIGALALKILGAGGVVAATAIATHYAERC